MALNDTVSLHMQGDDMPELEEHALLKQAYPDLVLFQDLVAERPGETWNEVLVRLLQPLQPILFSAFPATAFVVGLKLPAPASPASHQKRCYAIVCCR